MMQLKPVDVKKIYLVTGAAGFIGMHVSKKLLELGCTVIGLDNMNDYYDVRLKSARLDVLKKHDRFTFYQVDLAEKSTLEALFSENRVNVVINLAAQAGVRYSIENPEVYIQSNIVGFLNILENCRHHPVQHLLYASSSSVYGANNKVPFATGDRVDNPVSLYAATKKSNELMAYTYSHLYRIPATGMRLFTVYGPYGRPDMAYFSFTKAIMENKPIRVFNNGDMYRDFTYIDDVVNGILPLIENSPVLNMEGVPYKIYNIGNNRPEKLLDFIAVIEKAVGKKAVMEFCPMQPGDVYKTFADVTDLVEDAGFRPNTGIGEGIDKFVAWYRGFYKC